MDSAVEFIGKVVWVTLLASTSVCAMCFSAWAIIRLVGTIRG